jgi:CMP-N-acetylneuraminic acid synthetase
MQRTHRYNFYKKHNLDTKDSLSIEEIAEIAKSLGAKVPFMRSMENSADKTATAPVLEEVIMVRVI